VREGDEFEEGENVGRRGSEKGVKRERGEGEKDKDEPSVGVERFAIRWSDTENGCDEDVLE